MTFKQITDSFKKRFFDLSSSINRYRYQFNHSELDSDSFYFDSDSEKKKQCAGFICECYRDLLALSADVSMFRRFASKDSEKETLWNLCVEIDDFSDKFFDFVLELRCMYHWDY